MRVAHHPVALAQLTVLVALAGAAHASAGGLRIGVPGTAGLNGTATPGTAGAAGAVGPACP